MSTLSTHLDKTAIGISLLCALHCLLLPVALVMLPALTATMLGNEEFHKWLLLAVIPTSLLALGLGCRRHHNLSVLLLVLPGLGIILAATFFGHDLMGETGEKLAMLTGALLITLGHVLNHRLCRQLQCAC